MKNLTKILLFLLIVTSSFGQVNKQPQNPHKVFKEIEKAIASGNTGALANFFNSQTYLSLFNGKSGYFSSNQAYYVMENFLKIYRVLVFKFHDINVETNSPYASGVYIYDSQGNRLNAKIYISLKCVGSSWKITQITIN